MTVRILQSKSTRNVIIHMDANGTIAVGNASLNTSPGEVITGLSIRSITSGVDRNGAWNIQRGANTVFVTNISGTVDFAGQGFALTFDPTANVTATLVGSANGTIMIDCMKQVSSANGAY